ncbi:MAG: 50S ribosomal protein L11 [Elusimicrobia bacterium]|nr:50S ribosomal protein L11 [Elusimicrobiota bacterium]
MATKKVKTQVRLQIPATAANPAPPVGPALGQHGVNIMDFCRQFNEKTKSAEPGMLIPVVITIYQDRTFSFITKVPPVSALLKKACGIAKASSDQKVKIATITKKQIQEIAKQKMPDLNANSVEAAAKIVEGTARSMGIEVK